MFRVDMLSVVCLLYDMASLAGREVDAKGRLANVRFVRICSDSKITSIACVPFAYSLPIHASDHYPSHTNRYEYEADVYITCHHLQAPMLFSASLPLSLTSRGTAYPTIPAIRDCSKIVFCCRVQSRSTPTFHTAVK